MGDVRVQRGAPETDTTPTPAVTKLISQFIHVHGSVQRVPRVQRTLSAPARHVNGNECADVACGYKPHPATSARRRMCARTAAWRRYTVKPRALIAYRRTYKHIYKI